MVLWALPSFKPVERKRFEFIQRWFTPSDSDQQSGAQYNEAYNKAGAPGLPKAPSDAKARGLAEEEIARLRRMRAMAGGQTILSSSPTLTGSGGKTLLGA